MIAESTPWPRWALYWRYPMSHPALPAIFRASGFDLWFRGVIVGPLAIGVMWRTRAEGQEGEGR